MTGRDDTSSPSALISRIADDAKVSQGEVLTVLDAHGIDLTVRPRQKRSVMLVRLRLVGIKANTSKFDGPFDRTFTFPLGMTVLATEANLRGKTSVLEIIAWCLRGSIRRLRDAVRSWLRLVELDVILAGEPIGIRLDLRKGFSAVILASRESDALSDVDASGEVSSDAGVRVLMRAESEADFAAFMNALILERLDLSPVSHWHRHQQGDDDGRAQLDKWPSLFSVLYLPDGGDTNLLGDTGMNGLPGRLLQLYLSLPLAAERTRVQVARQAVTQVERHALRRTNEDALARSEARERVATRLTEARASLSAFRIQRENTSDILADENEAATRLLATQRRRQVAAETLVSARSARQADQKEHEAALETALAERLFHGLSPRYCPRCETPVSAARAEAERTDHQCAVCTSDLELDSMPAGHVDKASEPLNGEASAASMNGDDDLVADADLRVQASVAAEEAARSELAAAEDELREAREVFEQAKRQADRSVEGEGADAYRILELEVARLEGALEAMPTSDAAAGRRQSGVDVRVLAAAENAIDRVVRDAAGAAFDELAGEIVFLARDFGIDGITAARTDLSARLRVTIDGSESWFSSLSRGERLRLRVATVVALLRVGARHGIGTHPGLLLVDSPGSEEVAAGDVQALLSALNGLQVQLPELQVVVATAQPAILARVEASRVYQSVGDDPLW